MLKHSETILNSSIRRQDTTWDYRWDYYNPDDPDTIYLDPQISTTDSVLGNAWKFCGDVNEFSLVDENIFDPDNPFLQYDANINDESGEGPNQSTNQWDANHPDNPTKYLTPDAGKYLTINNSIQDVIINPIPPKFITDDGTEYLSIESTFENGIKSANKETIFTNATRTVVLQFKDEVGLDYKQVAVYTGDDDNIDWGNITSLPSNVLYYYDRNLEKPLKQDYVENIKMNATKNGTYEVVLSLYEKWADIDKKGNISNEQDIKDIINTGETKTIEIKQYDEVIQIEKYVKSQLNLIVWDLSGNYSIYHITRPFNTLSIEDLNNLQPIQILFTNIEPSNYYINDSISCNIVTKLQNPNVCLLEYEDVAQLTETSVGLIDISSYNADDNRQHIPLDGIRTFVINTIKKSGYVIVEAWIETGFPEVDAVIKDRTYNTAKCGPWVYGDEGRKYNITPSTPKYLQGTEFGDFIQFFELYINTIYKNMDGDKNISGLEKIARINNFNDIQHLEDALVYQYAKEHGNEFDFNIESLQNVNLITDGSGFTTRDVKETYDIVKYVLEQLPNYNSYKGTNTGIQMAIKMFGFTCKVINMWIQKEHPIEEDPTFYEEDRLYSLNDYFMTSRFDIELDASNNLFETFVNNVDMFIKLIKSIKPLTKILNEIKYTVYVEKDMNLIYELSSLEDQDSKELTYTFDWDIDIEYNSKDYLNIVKLCKIDETTGTGDLLCLNYHPNKIVIEGDDVKKPDNVYNILGKFFQSNYELLYLKFSGKNKEDEVETITYEFNKEGILPVLNTGYLAIHIDEASNATNCYNIIKKFFNENCKVTVSMSFTLQHGTSFGKCNKP